MKTKTTTYNIGKMKQRLQFQYYSLSSDGMGGNTQTWNNLVSVWADVMPYSGKEEYELGGLKGKNLYKIVTRYRGDLISAGYTRGTYDYLLRILYDSKTLNVLSVKNLGEENTYVEILAEEEVNA